MSKTTNKNQIDVLLNTMQANPNIARGMFKGSKEELNRVWRNLEAELNAAGPPSKSIAEWKKVWCDQKKYVRHKAAQNLRHTKGTGGGPNMQQKFSPNEEAIYHLIGMKESVEGVANTFGLGSSITTSSMEGDENVPPVLQEFLVDVLDEDEHCVVESDKDVTQQPPAKKIKTAQIALPTRVSPGDVLAEEICIQNKMLEAMREQVQNTKKSYRSIERLYELKKKELEKQKQLYYLKKEELEEQKRLYILKKEELEEQKRGNDLEERKLEEERRHNFVMEKLRLREVEDKIQKNRKLLELKYLKYKQ